MKDKQGRTPLWMASMQGFSELVPILMVAGANINAKDKYGMIQHKHLLTYIIGRTPLYMAVYKGDLGLVRLLVSYGADLDTPDVEQHTPIVVAYHKGFWEIEDYLKEQGCLNYKRTDSDETICEGLWGL